MLHSPKRRQSAAAPAADPSPQVSRQSGAIALTTNITSPTGMILLRFTSDAATPAAGWSASWRVFASAPSVKYCTDRNVSLGSGEVEDGSGPNNEYGNK